MSDTPRIEYSRQDDPLTWDLPNDAGAITFVGVEDAQKAQALFCGMQSEIKNYKERYETCLEQLAKEKDKSEAQFKKDQKERLRLHEAKLSAEAQKEYLREQWSKSHDEVLRLADMLRKLNPTWGSPMHLNRVLAVGEPCAGAWIQSRVTEPYWSCRCGAQRPEQCKTETAKP